MHKLVEIVFISIFGFIGVHLSNIILPNNGLIPAILGITLGSILGYLISTFTLNFLSKHKLNNITVILIISSIILGGILAYYSIEYGSTMKGNKILIIFSVSCVSAMTGILWIMCLENKSLLYLTLLAYAGGELYFIIFKQLDSVEALLKSHIFIGLIFIFGYGIVGDDKNKN